MPCPAFAPLQEAEARMLAVPIGDLAQLESALKDRQRWLEAALQQAAQSEGDARGQARQHLQASLDAGMRTIRQLILARYILQTELGGLLAERRFLDALREQPPTPPRIELSA